MVPFLYVVYARSGVAISAQTVVAHATSLGVAFVTATIGTWRYARARAIAWGAAGTYALPGILSAFVVARILTKTAGAHWIRAAFAVFLLISALDMARRAPRATAEAAAPERAGHSWWWLAGVGFIGGGLSALLGIGGGLIAVPALIYVGRLPVKSVAPTALAGVCLTTLAGGIGYLTAGPGPAVSEWMTGFMDARMLLPLSLGAAVTVPLGVRVNRKSSPPTLYWWFAAIFAAIGASILWAWARG
jgi:uncharacterized membrane protein YfcA